jgi:hypothetical protein
MGPPAAVGFDARARECGAHRRCFEGRGLQRHSGSPPLVDGSTVCRLESMPLAWYDYSTVDHYEWWDHRPLDGSTASHPPCACAIAASKRSSCARRPSSRVAARTRTTAIGSDTPMDRVHGGQLSRGQQLARRQGDACRRRSRRRDGSSDKRREQPRSRSREPPTAVTSGRPMRTMIHERRRPNFGPEPTTEALDITGGVAKIGGRWQR